ncbi:hypothetical protein GQ55_8G209400 [Panicum hallii var. hallii]|uniref:DUF4220 domain-containing protein n=1 Tax=Panicum hallii var. hallii TaxID=1504633 RepID=A0A2T7CPM7_9POAL|nr:hypothetical protein GQ55_8G209400 [Panicum hallii var. hallii]
MELIGSTPTSPARANWDAAMGFWSDVQWWEDWQLRFLVLASLFFQYFLFAAALLRKRRVPLWFRSLVWLAYQGGDVVAVYALATLFNRHRKDEVAAGAAAHLDTLWAPVLLLHLGGQDGITAYSVEDNENWRRYLLVAASQIAIAIYVFCKSWWSPDGRLLRAAILLFVPGVVKCLEKPLALRNATVNSIANSSDPTMEMSIEEDDGTLPTAMDSLEEFVTAAKKCVEEEARRDPPLFFDDTMNDKPYHLFVDLSHPYSIRLRNLQVMAARSGKEEAHDRVRASISQAFDRLFTKHKASYGGVLRAVVVLLTFADIGLFQESRRSAYARADVVVTYILLCCTAALEFVSACVVLGSGLPLPDDQVPQYNLIGYLARTRRRPGIRHLAAMLGLKDQIDWLWCTAPPEPSRRITELVHDHVAGGWKGYINAEVDRSSTSTTSRSPVDDYRRFNDGRGQRTLERAKCGGRGVESSLRLPFDESVLVWHLATEICYFDHVDAGGEATRRSRVISNYMAYLLLVRPWMLMPGARRGLFRTVHAELKEMLKDAPSEPPGVEDDDAGKKKAPPRAMYEIARKIIQKVRNPPAAASSGGARRPWGRKAAAELVRKAWDVAYDLMEFSKVRMEESRKKKVMEEEKIKKTGDPVSVSKERMSEIMSSARTDGDDEMWGLIQGVWVEMLCFSAGRCRGYLHAKSLGKGGEYLSYVWLLLSHMGMETMAERMQRTELPAEGDAGGLVTPSDLEDDDGDEPAQLDRGATSSTAVSGAAVVPVVVDDDIV